MCSRATPVTGASVLVVGAGAAGLAAATHLRLAGRSVTVLEERDRVGGRLHTTNEDGYVADFGGMIFASGYTEVLSLLDRLGLRDQMVPAPTIAGFARGGNVHHVDTARLVRSGLGTKVLSTRSKLRMTRVLADAVRFRRVLDDEDLSSAAAFDIETSRDYGLRRGNQEIYDFVIDAAIRALLAVPGESSSAVDFLYTLNKFLGAQLYVMSGGLGGYARSLAADLDVRTGARVHQVVELTSCVEVTWTDAVGTEHVDEVEGCVLAVPGDRVNSLAPRLPDAVSSVLGEVRYGSTTTVKLWLERPPRGLDAFMVVVPRPVDEKVSVLGIDHNLPGRVPPGKGLIGAYLVSDAARRLADADPAVVVDTTLAGVEKVIPGIGDLVRRYEVLHWPTSVVLTRPGLYRQLGHAYAARPRGRLHLAGDYFSSSNVNTATTAGARAARELLLHLPA